nr:MAG TPA: hypothetical protein [Caudoviricetes sp.]
MYSFPIIRHVFKPLVCLIISVFFHVGFLPIIV